MMFRCTPLQPYLHQGDLKILISRVPINAYPIRFRLGNPAKGYYTHAEE
jgi:hypothetical protein